MERALLRDADLQVEAPSLGACQAAAERREAHSVVWHLVETHQEASPLVASRPAVEPPVACFAAACFSVAFRGVAVGQGASCPVAPFPAVELPGAFPVEGPFRGAAAFLEGHPGPMRQRHRGGLVVAGRVEPCPVAGRQESLRGAHRRQEAELRELESDPPEVLRPGESISQPQLQPPPSRPLSYYS